MATYTGNDNVIHRRFINTPTLKELSDEVLDGIEEQEEQEVKNELLKEYEEAKIEGNESLDIYNVLLRNFNNSSIETVTGNEGFFETIKNWVANIFKAIFNFFKSLLGFNGDAGKHRKNKAALKKMEFKTISNLKSNEFINYKPNKTVYNLVKGNKVPEDLEWVKQLNKDLFALGKLQNHIVGEVSKAYEPYLQLMVKTVDVMTGETVSKTPLIDYGGKNNETVYRENLVKQIVETPNLMSYEFKTDGKYKVEIAKASNSLPSDAEVKEMVITAKDANVLKDTVKALLSVNDNLLNASEEAEKNLKDITAIKDKLTSKLEKVKDNPEEAKRLQKELNVWVSAFNFWKYWSGEFTNKVFVRTHDTVLKLLQDLDTLNTSNVKTM